MFKILWKKLKNWQNRQLHIHFYTIHLKYTHIAKLPDLIGVQ